MITEIMYKDTHVYVPRHVTPYSGVHLPEGGFGSILYYFVPDL